MLSNLAEITYILSSEFLLAYMLFDDQIINDFKTTR